MTLKKIICSVGLLAGALSCSQADAAAVAFLGTFNGSQAGPVLGSTPRNFVLTLNYTPNPGGGAPALGTMEFLATPNGGTTNMTVHPPVTVMVTGNISLANNFMTMSGPVDRFTYAGAIASPQLGPNNVNFAFSFSKPSDTISSGAVTPNNIAPLVGGQSTFAFIGGAGGPNGVGTIRGAPEPSTMIALTGLIAGGCGIGYRRRIKAKAAEETKEQTC